MYCNYFKKKLFFSLLKNVTENLKYTLLTLLSDIVIFRECADNFNVVFLETAGGRWKTRLQFPNHRTFALTLKPIFV